MIVKPLAGDNTQLRFRPGEVATKATVRPIPRA